MFKETCVVCGREFMAHRITKKTCSDRCRKALSRKSDIDDVMEQSGHALIAMDAIVMLANEDDALILEALEAMRRLQDKAWDLSKRLEQLRVERDIENI